MPCVTGDTAANGSENTVSGHMTSKRASRSPGEAADCRLPALQSYVEVAPSAPNFGAALGAFAAVEGAAAGGFLPLLAVVASTRPYGTAPRRKNKPLPKT